MAYARVGNITAGELKKFDGSDPTLPVCVAIRGKVYNVSSATNFYGPGGPYAVFAGKDASRGLAKMSTKPDEVSGPLDDLSEKEMTTLLDWEKKFSDKYPVVGGIVSSG
ncbi:hypothetical protein SELMODRAFT_228191 [Selaginella moellendorffii]|uniref:Cytochrome b5 heme-binding domain-containing protein n=1 Tax=Selaginella moellendorffii TaxID=88036 RepID=D8RQX1_SELML|nr:probable steroid-binding protein 3 [Selaginella moellendorffii]XP_002975524.1 probable steroid-binding protein 3 [Selaginella moellendorffii]XP_002994670.1 probable steroid-binding protein 3 [Selaginella moellendorffii]EFJ04266.1 hypothetical protein SELMODRAFT_272366 [Selaginella moellendorffii]EFJ23153.1 hypothetical protein SELMODRAFT_150630 [Selaginella moellendorffii]EFJ25148.1 hypothetical protein SELMODRAFT_228191 [Selaginella moellendorffii]|eukprot:XP_002973488.1 probable steroid-binding protein 3 [Selaginella moellendorffii]